MEHTKTFETVCRYGELQYKRREGLSKAKNYSHLFFYNHWKKDNIMVLFEGEKRIVGNRTEPEVCWICIDSYGELYSIPSRYLRGMEQVLGFGFIDGVWEAMFEVLDWAEERDAKNKR